MAQKCDIEIAQETKMRNITEVAAGLGIDSGHLEQYGRFKAKIDLKIMDGLKGKPDGKLILVTAISPTPAGEGKTTTTIGIGDALSRLGKKTIIALREPSLGPVFGVKGGAAGGGYAQVVPMEDINLHFTGDIHAVGTANNLLAAMIDNHIYQCNSLGIDAKKITWKRCMDMNDRQLRSIVSGLGGKVNGVPREDGFDITVASEIMAILCLSTDIDDLKRRLDNIVVGYTFDDAPVRARQLNASGAMAVVLKDAINPNLVQTLEHTPALIHGGPFANIAHGSNSVIATKLALKLAGYVVTEAGFGADLGAEKFIDITCRSSGFMPDAAVIVATVRALKHHGGGDCEGSLEKGMGNLERHIMNLTGVFNLPTVVAINRFPTDSPEDIKSIIAFCETLGIKAFLSDVWANGGNGGLEIASELVKMCLNKVQVKFLYENDLPLKQKIEKIAKDIYHSSGVEYSAGCEKDIKKLEDAGFGGLPVCVAKTQYSFTDDPKRLGAPVDFKINVSKVKVSAGAGFVVAITGDIMTMPGLPKVPAAEKMDIDSQGRIIGLF